MGGRGWPKGPRPETVLNKGWNRESKGERVAGGAGEEGGFGSYILKPEGSRSGKHMDGETVMGLVRLAFQTDSPDPRLEDALEE